ncbi:MAG: nucleotidyltransferase family protein [Pseudomonadota bacterium]
MSQSFASELRELAKQQAFSNKPEDELLDFLELHGLFPLATSINENQLSSLPEHKSKLFAEVARANLQQTSLLQLLSAIEEAGLPRPLVFKGSALANQIYDELWLRPKSDHDLLIPEDLKDAYDRVFNEEGFTKLVAIEGQLVSYQSSYAPRESTQASVYFDVHWKLSNRQCFRSVLEFSELCSRHEQIKLSSSTFCVPSLVDSLLIAAIHRCGHHANEDRLIWLYDVHLLCQQLDDAQQAQLINLATQHRLIAIMQDTLQNAFDYFAGPHTEALLVKLVAHTSLLADEAIEPSAALLRAANSRAKLLYLDLVSLPSWRLRLLFVIENCFPSADYLRGRYQTPFATLGFFKRLLRFA